jgi:hypothetical protein
LYTVVLDDINDCSGVAWFRLGFWIRRVSSGVRAWTGTDTSYVRKRRTNSPCIFEMPRRAEMKRGTPEQQMAACERGNSTQEDIHFQKCH